MQEGAKTWQELCFSSLQEVLLTGGVLEALSCGKDQTSKLRTILSVPEEQRSVLDAYQISVCGGNAEQRAERFAEISQELKDQIDTQKITDKVKTTTTTFNNSS